jgi:hypothetical protein
VSVRQSRGNGWGFGWSRLGGWSDLAQSEPCDPPGRTCHSHFFLPDFSSHTIASRLTRPPSGFRRTRNVANVTLNSRSTPNNKTCYILAIILLAGYTCCEVNLLRSPSTICAHPPRTASSRLRLLFPSCRHRGSGLKLTTHAAPSEPRLRTRLDTYTHHLYSPPIPLCQICRVRLDLQEEEKSGKRSKE